ncbi:coiled-coil domain-containing protein mad1 [Diatrype stigma]|uniref:Spindle assembly checkpoint component MAD1 n=1 Tax=Diatrype stigma TaxID=117547 RepID=A0AAN9URR8_9PEZI
MGQSSPNNKTPTSANRRGSMNGSFRMSGGGSMFQRGNDPLRKSRVSSFRASQSSYNVIPSGETPPITSHHARQPSQQSAGAESMRAASRESSKENLAPPDAEEYETQRKRIEELKAEVSTLQYRIQNDEQEKEMAVLQHENELREVRRKAEEDFKQMQTAEGDRSNTLRQYERIVSELNEVKERSTEEKAALEKKTRDADDEARLLREQLEDISAAKEEGERMNQKRLNDLETQVLSMQQTIQDFEQIHHARELLLQQAQEQLSDRDRHIGDLEADVLRLKAQTGDAETIAVIRRELTDQVQHIRSLEARNAKQHAELNHLRQIHRAVEVVEEEKRSLQRKLETAQSLETELDEERIQRQRLEDERLAWTAYLQSEAGDGMMEFDSPEAVARALVQERYTSASLMERLGEVQPQVAERDEIIRSLEQDKNSLNAQIEKLKTSPAPVSAGKVQARLERQRLLAVKEVEYLRAQLKTFDTEDDTFDTGKYDQNRVERISELEKLVDQYKEEVQALHKELAAAESNASASASEPLASAGAGTKRARPHDENDENESEQLGELNRKRRKLADDLAKLQAEHKLLQKEHKVAKERLAAASAASKTRVLALRSNPTSDFEAVQRKTLEALKKENRDLLATLQQKTGGRGSSGGGSARSASAASAVATIPASQLAAARREVDEARAATASAEKRARRLKEVWALKSQEFKEAIFSTLGWTVTFIPNGKMRVESVFCPSPDSDDGEHENSIVFDGERGTMKVSGGPQSPFARRIADQIQFWVRDKGCIPGFLAALTLEFYEEQQHQNQSQGQDQTQTQNLVVGGR